MCCDYFNMHIHVDLWSYVEFNSIISQHALRKKQNKTWSCIDTKSKKKNKSKKNQSFISCLVGDFFIWKIEKIPQKIRLTMLFYFIYGPLCRKMYCSFVFKFYVPTSHSFNLTELFLSTRSYSKKVWENRKELSNTLKTFDLTMLFFCGITIPS